MTAKTGRNGVTKEPSPRRSTIAEVNGGTVKRNAETGRFVEVRSSSGTFRAKPDSEAVIDQASKDRHDVLKRLANR
jgi:hypothetical protein